MRPDLLNYIRELSVIDRKTLSQKGLKASEEVGELAKAILPYDSAFGNNHRFVTKNKILEEVADTILVALSIAYSLDFTDEEISDEMKRKNDYWAELLSREAVMTDRTPYEIHVTVKEAPDVETFRQACAALEVKPIILDLQLKAGVLNDVMTSSVYFGTNRDAYEEMERIATGLTNTGFDVVRRKIETVPWHPAAPSRTSQEPVMPPHCYFECHFSVKVNSPAERGALEVVAAATQCHLSRNVFKTNSDGTQTVMMTYRSYDGLYEDVQAQVEMIKRALVDASFVLGKSNIEFSIFDSKVNHDSAWISK